MSKSVEVYFDVGSPSSYLAWTQLPGLARRQHATINWKPMLLGGVFKATGNQSPMAVTAKGKYTALDLMRFARQYNVSFAFNPHFPINTLQIMRGAVAYLGKPPFEDYLSAVFKALWAERKNLGDSQVFADVLARAGFDPAEVFERCDDPEVKDRLKALTEEAVDRGVFGAPTFFVGDEMFFGQDRLEWVERALASASA